MSGGGSPDEATGGTGGPSGRETGDRGRQDRAETGAGAAHDARGMAERRDSPEPGGCREPLRDREPGRVLRNHPRPLSVHDALARPARMQVLDVRPEPAFASGHVAGSGNIPLAEMAGRRPELPGRDDPLLVVADDPAVAARAAEELARTGFAAVDWLDAPLAELPGGRASRAPAERLWRPAAFLEELLPGLPRGAAADLASGAGREAVFLAMNGFAVEAWDAAPEALESAARLAARHGVAVRAVLCDLEAPAPPLPEAHYRLVTCFRFLHRPLFPIIERALAPGGHLVYETYRVGQERIGRPRRRRFLLERGELRAAFAGLEILRYEEPEPAGGPIAARLHARKRG